MQEDNLAHDALVMEKALDVARREGLEFSQLACQAGVGGAILAVETRRRRASVIFPPEYFRYSEGMRAAVVELRLLEFMRSLK